jgi:hypothetical protein
VKYNFFGNQYARTLSEIDLISIFFKKASRVNALEGAFNLIPYSMPSSSIHLVSQVLPFCYCLCLAFVGADPGIEKVKRLFEPLRWKKIVFIFHLTSYFNNNGCL